jgi:predicted choloylglycine hydrolase
MSKVILTIILLMACVNSYAQDPIAWGDLTAEQQRVLKKFEGRWNNLPPHKQNKLSRGAQNWQNMTPEKQNKIRERYKWYKDLPPEKRESLREKWQGKAKHKNKKKNGSWKNGG